MQLRFRQLRGIAIGGLTRQTTKQHNIETLSRNAGVENKNIDFDGTVSIKKNISRTVTSTEKLKVNIDLAVKQLKILAKRRRQQHKY